MEDKNRPRATYPVCQEHWNRMADEALSGLPFWSRPLARLRVKRVLNEKGFVRSDSECRFCKTKTEVEEVQ